MESFEVQRVGTEQIRKVIAGYRPRGLFLARENGKWVAVDKTTAAPGRRNSTGKEWPSAG